MRLGDLDALKEDFADMREGYPIFSDTEMLSTKAIAKIIDNAPTVDYPFYQEAYQTGYEEGKNERPQGEWARHDEWVGGEYVGGFYHVNCPCEDGYYSKWETNFCPNCGLPMKKGGAE
jgi:hypothetical protein